MHDPRLRREHFFTKRSGGQDRVGVSPLGRDHGAIDLVGAAVIEVAAGSAVIPTSSHMSLSQVDGEVAHIAGATPVQNIDGLVDFEGVAYGPPEGLLTSA